MSLISRLRENILVLDGAMGTMIMKESLSEEDFRSECFSNHPVPLKGCNDLLCLTNPIVIERIHQAYLEAGADIISTNSFNANSISLSEYQLSDKVEEICFAAASIARKAVEEYCTKNAVPDNRHPFVAGSMGPTGMSLSISMQESPDPAANFDKMADAYYQQASALIKGGVDLLLLETVFDLLNAKAAVYGILKAFNKTAKKIPLIISATVNENGRLLSGHDLRQFVDSLNHANPMAFGLNCGFGAETLIPFVRELGSIAPGFVSVHPNAGLPDDMGCYLDTPEKMGKEVEELLQSGSVNIIGGCCGTTPLHISVIARMAANAVPHNPLNEQRSVDTPADPSTKKFTVVGERCNVAGSRKFLRLVSSADWKECMEIAVGQIKKGADILDINMDDAMLDAETSMRMFISRLVSDPRTASVPLMIDSSDFKVISQALRLIPIRGYVNSISLKNGEKEFLDHAMEIHALGCSMVVMAFDEEGQAVSFERRIEICSRAYKLLTDIGIPAESIIFDPNVLAVATGISAHDNYALDFIRTTDWIKHNLPGAKVSGGISNLSFSFRGIDPVRTAMHSLFLEHNIAKGMDMAIINPATPLSGSELDPEVKCLVEAVLLNSSPSATDALIAYATDLKKEIDAKKKSLKEKKIKDPGNEKDTIPESSSALLSKALLDGDTSNLNNLVEGALHELDGSAMKVVDLALMRGMEKVGELFGRGEIFLPQVVRSASVMKKAVEILTPVIESESNSGENETQSQKRPVIVLATVKGDVHDIGKNIVAVVLRCSGFNVVDLGVMVPPEKIIDAAQENNAVAIGLSGLITPSLHEMAIVASMMEERNMEIPLFIGGATTSELHTAVRIAPLYSGPVIRTSDAASLPPAIKEFTSSSPSEAIEALKRAQKTLRDNHSEINRNFSPEEARRNNYKVTSPAPSPLKKGAFLFDIPIQEITSLINWRAFLSEWRLDPSKVKDKPVIKALNPSQEDILLAHAKEILQGLKGNMKAKVLIVSASGIDDELILDEKIRIPVIRQSRPNPFTGKTTSLADFISAHGDYIAIFAVTAAGSGLQELIEDSKLTDEYRSLLLQSLSHRLAEAATEWTHRKVCFEIFGLPEKQGIRPAIGYPSLPDQSLVFDLDKMIDYRSLGIELTSAGALSPSATTTGFILLHPQARYFDTGELSQEAKEEYAPRRGWNMEQTKTFLQ